MLSSSGDAYCQAVAMIQPVFTGLQEVNQRSGWFDVATTVVTIAGLITGLCAALQDYDYGTVSLPDSADSHTSIRAALDDEQGR